MSAKLEELEDRPASVSMDIAPDGSLGLHLTRWEDGQTTFIWGAPVVNQNHEVEEFDMLYYDVTAGFGAAPEVHDIVYSSTMGFVVCGQKSDDRLWCQTVSEGAERPLPPTQLSQAPVFTGIRDLTALQLGVSADGTLHVFWTQESAGEGRDLHHAAIR
jgi:hypothetical protein